jgi:hypothetical protein
MAFEKESGPNTGKMPRQSYKKIAVILKAQAGGDKPCLQDGISNPLGCYGSTDNKSTRAGGLQ